MLGKLIVWLTFCLESLLLRNGGCGLQWLVTTCKTRAVFASLAIMFNCIHCQAAVDNHRKQAPYEYRFIPRPHPKHQERGLVTTTNCLTGLSVVAPYQDVHLLCNAILNSSWLPLDHVKHVMVT